ncbi:MAG: hypothetical protein IT162_22900, partial [Bryobacterales bacterium]|nr:hypothetical protein [Bryobacterales bacterium]
MKKAIGITVLLALGALWLASQSSTQTTLVNPPAGADAAFLVRLGVADKQETKWDGSVEAANGELVQVIGYEMRLGDLVHPPARWEARSRPAFVFARRPHDEGFLKDIPGTAILPASLFVYVKGSEARLSLRTAQGEFGFLARDVPPGAVRRFLEGRVEVQHTANAALVGRGVRTPDRVRLTDNDYPSIAVTRDNVIWVAWQGFDLEGDRVFAQPPGARAPHAVSRKGADVFRTAIAADSEGKVWVVWSERVDDNWDLYARSFDGTSWSSTHRLTTASQPDAQHQMARDGAGRLHLVWQGWRDNRAGVFHKQYDVENGWSAETRVSAPDAPNCWEPALTIGEGGALAVAWDQYGPNGYDVWMRARRGAQWQAPLAVANTARYEAHVSAATDKAGRVWLAWHESGINWGKDWGYPYDIQANATGLYNWRKIRMAVYENGKLLQPPQALEDALPPPLNNYYEYPHLAADGEGRIHAFFRKRTPMQYNVYPRTPSHQALWEIYTSVFDGKQWSPMTLLPYSTGRHDMRMAAVTDRDGVVAAAWPSDRRGFRDFINALPDIFAARFPRTEAVAAAALRPYDPAPEQAAPVHINEPEDVRKIRAYRYAVNGQTYRIFRGDMHRHTEISWDGYSDGSTEDTYRYAIDAAAMDFLAITEHNFGVEDEYDWWRSQKLVDLFRVGNAFVPLFGYERSATYPNGHRNIIFSYRGAPVLDVQHYEWGDNPNYQRQGAERLFGYLRK